MSVITYALLQNEAGNLFDQAITKGIIHAGGIYSARQSTYFYKEHLLDFSACSPEEWEKDKKRFIEAGVVDCSRKTDDGKYGVRRDLTEKEVSTLSLWPISKDKNGGILIFSNYDHGAVDNAAFYVSLAFPDSKITVSGDTEGDAVFSYTLVNGVMEHSAI